MKKSQILAALALAFALGVVAPVASTTNTVSAFTVEDKDAVPFVEGKATATDVNNAVAAVKANVTYKNMNSLKNAVEKAPASASDYVTSEDDEYVELYPSANNFDNRVAAVDNRKATADAFDAIDKNLSEGKISFLDATKAYIQLAQKVQYSDKLTDIQNAIANDDNSDYINKIRAFNAVLTSNGIDVVDITDVSTINSTTTGSVYTQAAALLKKIYNNSAITSTDVSGLIENLYAYEVNLEKYTAGLNALTAALNASGVLNEAGQTRFANLKNAEPVLLNSANGLASLADDDYANHYDSWTNEATTGGVAYTLKAAAKPLDLDSNTNYVSIINIAKAYKTATNNGSQSDIEVAATLVGYKAPAEQNTISEGPVAVTGAFPADYKLSVVKSDKKIAAFGDAKYAMWDINITDKNNNKVNVEGSVMVTINVPEGFDAAKSSVYFVTAEGKVEKLAARVENGKMAFTTSHFSLYAIVEDNGKNFGIGAPDTGIVAGTENSASTTVAMVAGVATALTAAGAGVVAYRNARRSTRK